MWLGISLISCFDFLEVIMDICKFGARIWKNMKETDEKRLKF